MTLDLARTYDLGSRTWRYKNQDLRGTKRA